MKFGMKQGFVLFTVMLLLCSPSFANGKRQITPQQRQIQQHSVAANKQRNWEANRTQRELYQRERYRNGFGNYDLYYPRSKPTRQSRRASYEWFDKVYGAGSYANALAKNQLISDSHSKTVLNFLELYTRQLDITKELPSFISTDTWTQNPLINIDYFQEEIMPLAGIWELREVWYKPEDSTATEVISSEDGKKYLSFKKIGDINLRAFIIDHGKFYTWKTLVHVRSDDVSDLLKETPTKVATYTSANGSGNATDLVNENDKFYMERSGVYWQMKQYDKAVADMLQAIRLAPDKAEYYEGLAAIYIDQEKYDDALPYINKAIELNPNNGKSYIFRGYIYMKLGRNDLYQADFKRARKLGEKV